MRHIILYIASSIDQFIATRDHEVDWLENAAKEATTDHGYSRLLERIDTVIMGRKTFENVRDMDVDWPYGDFQTYVFSRNKKIDDLPEHAEVITGDIAGFVRKKKQETGKDIWLVGGGELISGFLKDRLIDEIMLFYAPCILGDGIPMFPGETGFSEWEVIDVKKYDSDFILCHYRLK